MEENTMIAFNLLKKQSISIKISNVLGQNVATVFNGELGSGEHQYKVGENTQLGSGIYFVTVDMEGKSFCKKMIVK